MSQNSTGARPGKSGQHPIDISPEDSSPQAHLSSTDAFELETQPSSTSRDDFQLESVYADQHPEPEQTSLYLPEQENLSPDSSPQLELEGMATPVFAIQLADGRTALFQRSKSLLESLETQDIYPQYQCREGYCGSCRAELLKGEIHYLEEPIAWVDDDEVLLCCAIPLTALTLRLPE
jgi:ferredoxin